MTISLIYYDYVRSFKDAGSLLGGLTGGAAGGSGGADLLGSLLGGGAAGGNGADLLGGGATGGQDPVSALTQAIIQQQIEAMLSDMNVSIIRNTELCVIYLQCLFHSWSPCLEQLWVMEASRS